MHKWLRTVAFTILVLICISFALPVTKVFAHEQRSVAGNVFVVGFMSEPAIEGQGNGVYLQVTGATMGMLPVQGLENTLKVDITYVPTNVSKSLTFRTISGLPGRYTADLIPTAPGTYKFRIFGTVQGIAVDETFTSGSATFGDVMAAKDFEFPQRQILGGVQQSVSGIGAGQGNISGNLGILTGIGGFVLGAIAIALVVRKK